VSTCENETGLRPHHEGFSKKRRQSAFLVNKINLVFANKKETIAKLLKTEITS
jgi:hypothetical protein|tara:strand:- start:613 stop:771 length:159 start_codon:yes stop_codon:yes gene_type:complete